MNFKRSFVLFLLIKYIYLIENQPKYKPTSSFIRSQIALENRKTSDAKREESAVSNIPQKERNKNEKSNPIQKRSESFCTSVTEKSQKKCERSGSNNIDVSNNVKYSFTTPVLGSILGKRLTEPMSDNQCGSVKRKTFLEAYKETLDSEMQNGKKITNSDENAENDKQKQHLDISLSKSLHVLNQNTAQNKEIDIYRKDEPLDYTKKTLDKKYDASTDSPQDWPLDLTITKSNITHQQNTEKQTERSPTQIEIKDKKSQNQNDNYKQKEKEKEIQKDKIFATARDSVSISISPSISVEVWNESQGDKRNDNKINTSMDRLPKTYALESGKNNKDQENSSESNIDLLKTKNTENNPAQRQTTPEVLKDNEKSKLNTATSSNIIKQKMSDSTTSILTKSRLLKLNTATSSNIIKQKMSDSTTSILTKSRLLKLNLQKLKESMGFTDEDIGFLRFDIEKCSLKKFLTNTNTLYISKKIFQRKYCDFNQRKKLIIENFKTDLDIAINEYFSKNSVKEICQFFPYICKLVSLCMFTISVSLPSDIYTNDIVCKDFYMCDLTNAIKNFFGIYNSVSLRPLYCFIFAYKSQGKKTTFERYFLHEILKALSSKFDCLSISKADKIIVNGQTLFVSDIGLIFKAILCVQGALDYSKFAKLMNLPFD